MTKDCKQEARGPQSSPELHFQIATICCLDWHDESCMLDLKLHNLLDAYSGVGWGLGGQSGQSGGPKGGLGAVWNNKRMTGLLQQLS